MKNRFLAVLLCAMLFFAVPVCAQELPLTGDWYADLRGLPVQLTLDEDGSYAFILPIREPRLGTWELKEDNCIYLDGAEGPSLYLDSETLYMDSPSLLFTREKTEGYHPADPMPQAETAFFEGYWRSAWVDVQGTAVPAVLLGDETDLYVNGTSIILGGPVFGDITLKMSFADGALTCTNEGATVTLQYQQDEKIRLTFTTPENQTTIWYLQEAYSAVLE